MEDRFSPAGDPAGISTADGLCEACTALDLEAFFSQRRRETRSSGRLTPPVPQYALGSIQELLDRADACRFCAMVAVPAQARIDNATILIDRDLGQVTTIPEVGPHCTAAIEDAICLLSLSHRWPRFCLDALYSPDYCENLEEEVRRNRIEFPGSSTWACDVVLRLPRPNSRSFNETTLFTFVQVYDTTRPAAEQRLFERRLDVDGPDFHLLQTWYKTCLAAHRDLCHRPDILKPSVPEGLRVIDFYKRCVVDAPLSCHYAALSYIWGGSQFVATANDLNALPWYLPDRPVLSETIADALDLCVKLEIPYLWVDGLCIVQVPNMNANKESQIVQMDRIYRAAELTICAASSLKATTGIFGKMHRIVRQHVFDFKGKSYAEPQSDLRNLVMYTMWNWRAWTYQERMLSRRLLILTSRQALWMCQCDSWMESTAAEPVAPDMVGLLHQSRESSRSSPEWDFGLKHTSSMPGTGYTYGSGDIFFKTYQLIVSQYSARKIGTPKDGLNAINGILKVLSESSGGDETLFTWGLPSSHFDVALLWRPRTEGRRSRTLKDESVIPSWTWAAWFSDAGLGVEWDISEGWHHPVVGSAVRWFVVQSDGSSKPLRDHDEASQRAEVCGLSPNCDPDYPPKVSTSLRRSKESCLHFLTTAASFRLGSSLSWREERSFDSWVPAYAFHLIQDCVPDDPYELLDADSVCVGHIVLSKTEAVEARKAPINLIFLSYGKAFDHGILIPQLLKTAEMNKPPHITDWVIANCMLVVKPRESFVSERQCLAKVLVSAWLAAEPSSQWVVLG